MALSFTKLELGLTRNQMWQEVSCSADGSIIIGQFQAAIYDGNYSAGAYAYSNPIVISKDYGATWAILGFPDSGIGRGIFYSSWFKITADGSTIWVHPTGGAYRHLLYKTTDDGVSWTSVDFTDSQSDTYRYFAMNSTGTVLVAAGGASNFNAYVNISTNSGVSWASYNINLAAGNLQVTDISVSADGAKLLCRGTVWTSSGSERVYVSTDTAATWTSINPANTSGHRNAWDPKVSANGGLMAICARHNVDGDDLYTSIDDGVNWTKRTLGGVVSTTYGSPGLSADGSDILCADNAFAIYLSNDSGASFTEIEPAGTIPDIYPWWTNIIIQGNTMLALGGRPYGANIYLSLDAGSTWSEKRIGWTWMEWFDSISISQDGQTIIVSNMGDGVYFSTDMGSTWTAFVDLFYYSDGNYTGGDSDGNVVKVSRDGSTFFVGNRGDGKAYLSLNSGMSWAHVDVTEAGIGEWDAYIDTENAAISDDGAVIVIAGYFGITAQIVVTTDSGSTWNIITTPTSEYSGNWRVCCNSDGSIIYLGDYINKKIYKSTDYGANWVLCHTWSDWFRVGGVACSSDGTTVWAWYSGLIYRSVNSGATWLKMADEGLYYMASESDFAESVVINDDGSNIVLQCDDDYSYRKYPNYYSEDSGQLFSYIEGSGDDPTYIINEGDLSGMNVPAICGSTGGYIVLGSYYLWISSYGVIETFSDNGLYPAVVIHGDPVESGGNALRNQTKIRCDWRLPFVQQYIEWPPDSIVEYRRIRVQPSTFWTAEKSVESSRPIELHKFTTDAHVWRYADAPNDVDYTGGGVIWYRGNVISVSFKQYDRNGNREAEIIVDPFMSDLQTSGLTMRYERVCATYLGSDLCDVDLTDSGTGYSDTGVLTAVDGTSLTADEFGLQVDGWWEAGKIVVGDYKRKVMSHTGTTIIISYVIPSLAVGDAFTVYAGCDKVDSTCISKFDNIANFRGFPNIPKEDENPFGPNGY